MAKINMEATRMSEASVSFISLVGRGANRIPFKIVKQEKDGNMKNAFAGLDLTGVFKGTRAPAKPVVVGVACMKGDHLEALKSELKEAGFEVENMIEKDDGSVVFPQGGAVLKDDDNPTLIRLNEDVLLVTKGFSPYNVDDGGFSERVAAQGFYPGVSTILCTLGDTVRETVSASKAPGEAAQAVAKIFDEAKAYTLSFVNALPVAAFKMDKTFESVEKAKQKSKDTEHQMGDGEHMDDANCKEPAKKEAEDEAAAVAAAADGTRTAVTTETTDTTESGAGGEQVAKAAADEPTVETVSKDDVAALVTSEVAKAADTITNTMKAMLEGITKSVAGVAEQVTQMSGRIESVEGVAKAAKEAVTGTVIQGSDIGDQLQVSKQQKYEGREFDTAYQTGVRKKAGASR